MQVKNLIIILVIMAILGLWIFLIAACIVTIWQGTAMPMWQIISASLLSAIIFFRIKHEFHFPSISFPRPFE